MKDKGTQLFNKGDATFAGQIAKHPVVADTYQTFKGLIKDPTTITSKLTDLGNNFSGFASKVYKESETRRANLAIEIKQLEEQISELEESVSKSEKCPLYFNNFLDSLFSNFIINLYISLRKNVA